ncbi:autotransporter outer membrane beta-barrel domain-containing protein [Acinetobacter towneri]|uniref:autotransporter outer membrane beta-barrel domain-containing protein n=1 Tax=Acinetobacter towneri TaxID=202956 RepID=UPI0020985ECE|nr:autotransporter outer membrane beta-barrel domain-containing protein [Acinetobacter towneri]MCO8052810.1 autotransporter outer membrane beta-barrel domain-containing protein [Acinetobacter towneri]
MQIAADQQQHAGFKARFGNLLTVTGTANLAGTLNLFDEVPLDQPLITAQGSQTTVLRAQQGVQREFDAYRSSNPLFELTQVSYRPELNATGEPVRAADTINTDVVITAKRKSTETVAALAAELEGRTQVARNLDVVLASLDQKQQLETLEDAEKVFANRLFNNFAQTIHYSNAAESTVSTQALNQLFHQLDPSFYANTVLNVAEESSKQERQFAQRLATAQPKQLWFSGDYQSYDMDYVGLNSERRSHHQGVGVATKLAGMTLAAQADFSQLNLDDAVQTGSKNSSQSKAYALTMGTAQQLNRDLSVAAWLKGMQVDVDAQRGHAQAQKIQFDGQMYAAGLRLDYSYPLSQKMQIQPYLDASFQHYVHAEQTQQDGVNSLDDLVMQRWNFGAGLQANYQLNPAWQLQGSLYYSQPIQEKAYLDTHYVGTAEKLKFDAWHADQGQYHAALGSQLHFGQHSFINLNYEYSGRSHSDSHRVQLAVTTRF